jgi:hypothetical protein
VQVLPEDRHALHGYTYLNIQNSKIPIQIVIYEQYPDWATDWNEKRLADSYEGGSWELLQDPSKYVYRDTDLPGATIPTCPSYLQVPVFPPNESTVLCILWTSPRPFLHVWGLKPLQLPLANFCWKYYIDNLHRISKS